MTINNSKFICQWGILCLPAYTRNMTTVFSFQEETYTEHVQLCAFRRQYFYFQMMQ